MCGLLVSWVRSRMTSPLLTTAHSLLVPYACTSPRSRRLSGVIAVVVTGLLLAHRSPTDQSPAARLTEEGVWSTTQPLLEGAVFALVGLQLTDIVTGVSAPLPTVLLVSAGVLLTVLLVRLLWMFGLVYVARILPWSRRERPSPGSLAVISWAGMRGVVSLAAAHTLPLDLPQRDLFLLATMVVIVGTLGLQGLTLPAVIRKVGVEPPDPRQDALEVARAQQRATDAAKRRIGGDPASGGAVRPDGRDPDQAARPPHVRRLGTARRPAQTAGEGHHEVIPSGPSRSCEHLRESPAVVPDADPRECAACCDSSPRRHSAAHFKETGHAVIGSAEAGEHWRWCFVHERVG